MPKNPPQKDKNSSRKYLIVAAVFIAVCAAGLSGWLKHSKQSAAPAIELSAPLKEMKEDPKKYLSKERDSSSLLAQISTGDVRAIGFNADRALVLTATDDKYFVNNSRGHLTSTVIRMTQEAGENAPAFAFFDKPDNTAKMNTIFRGATSMLMFVLYGLLIFLCWRLYRDFKAGSHQPIESAIPVRFEDVIGVEEAKTSLKDVVQYLREPQRYTDLGARPPSGVLLLGGPGVGKTLLARALAGECNANFINASGSDFTSKYLGVGVQKVKSLFETARRKAPCIVFIDEIDGIARRTSASASAAESENNRIINQILVELDGFEKNKGVVVIGATNLAESLDEALLREGRFDRQVQVKLPDLVDRKKILEHYAKTIKINDSDLIDYDQLARLTTGFSPATLSYVINHSALIAARENCTSVTMEQMLESIETAHMGELNGAQRALSESERHRIAAHEAGHAIAAAVTGCGVVEKVTILPRGGALGVTLVTQAQDKMLHLRSDMEKRIIMLLAGRNAELQMFNEASSGAAHDLQECSKIAMSMVARFGFGEKGSLFNIDSLPGEHANAYIKESIEEANRLLEVLNDKCQKLLVEHQDALVALTDKLMEDETVSGEFVAQLIAETPLSAHKSKEPELKIA